MKPEQKSLRIGAAVILLAIFLRFLPELAALRTNPLFAAGMLFAATGRVYSVSPAPTEPDIPEESMPEETQPEPTEGSPHEFSPEDAVLVSVTNHPGYPFDVETLLQQPLSWDLTSESPTVLIVHSHTSESYENTEGYTPSDPYRTMDNRYNMVSVGSHLADCLRKQGISVIHDTTLHDYPSYNDAYPQSRKTIQSYLEQYPSIRLVLDIHRDAYEDSSGKQIRNTVWIDGRQSSQIMLVAGTNAGGQSHPEWEQNLAVAIKLQTVLQQIHPGLCRNLTVRSSAFNQDLSPGALLIEVGTAGDTRQDALNAAEFLADGIAALSYGSV